MALHEEAVRQIKADPALLLKAQAIAQRWLETGDPRSASLWREWQQILDARAWRKVLGRSRHAQQLRQASPLVTVLPEDVRQAILDQVSSLRKGVVLGGELQQPAGKAMTRDQLEHIIRASADITDQYRVHYCRQPVDSGTGAASQ